jgi:hypothetical protein
VDPEAFFGQAGGQKKGIVQHEPNFDVTFFTGSAYEKTSFSPLRNDK